MKSWHPIGNLAYILGFARPDDKGIRKESLGLKDLIIFALYKREY